MLCVQVAGGENHRSSMYHHDDHHIGSQMELEHLEDELKAGSGTVTSDAMSDSILDLLKACIYIRTKTIQKVTNRFRMELSMVTVIPWCFCRFGKKCRSDMRIRLK